MFQPTRTLLLAASAILWAAGTKTSAQTLTVTYPSATTTTPPLSQLPDGPKAQGNTEHMHRPVPSHAGKGGGVDTAVQVPLIEEKVGTSSIDLGAIFGDAPLVKK